MSAISVTITILVLFIVVSFLGGVYESIISPDKHHSSILFDKLNIHIPYFLPIYGFGAVILYTISWISIPLIPQIVIAVFILTLFECISGICAESIWGLERWNYGTDICHGYVSWKSIGVWTIVSAIFLGGIHLIRGS